MILDLDHFIEESQPSWQELEGLLGQLERGSLRDLADIERCYQLYERACADLGRLSTFAAAPEVQAYLDTLVARAYAEIHQVRRRSLPFAPWQLLSSRFPQAFRRHLRAFGLSLLVTLVGVLLGGLALLVDPAAKASLLPFSHLQQDPEQRVQDEESQDETPLAGGHAAFSAHLIRHNIRVSIFALALGMTFGLGTIALLFYNGVILGAVCFDYVAAGQGVFLAGWLLPHGAVEIPAILIAGQAGLVLAGALLSGAARRQRLREVRDDLVALVAGFAALLVWAGIVESFLSQTHQPVLPYSLKIALGLAELLLLGLWLGRAGR